VRQPCHHGQLLEGNRQGQRCFSINWIDAASGGGGTGGKKTLVFYI
jgi:hypothetical protein